MTPLFMNPNNGLLWPCTSGWCVLCSKSLRSDAYSVVGMCVQDCSWPYSTPWTIYSKRWLQQHKRRRALLNDLHWWQRSFRPGYVNCTVRHRKGDNKNFKACDNSEINEKHVTWLLSQEPRLYMIMGSYFVIICSPIDHMILKFWHLPF